MIILLQFIFDDKMELFTSQVTRFLISPARFCFGYPPLKAFAVPMKTRIAIGKISVDMIPHACSCCIVMCVTTLRNRTNLCVQKLLNCLFGDD